MYRRSRPGSTFRDSPARSAHRPRCRGEIVDALNAIRARYDYVFTTGGIGPTHDDITVDAVAKALGVGVVILARAILERYYTGAAAN
jgi:molybdopterin-biosynthesis enzyme MoeA-like protein